MSLKSLEFNENKEDDNDNKDLDELLRETGSKFADSTEVSKWCWDFNVCVFCF